MKIDLPDALRVWVEEQAQAHGHASADAFVVDLLRQEHERFREEIDRKLLEALDSGEPVEATPEFWEERRRVLAERLRDSGKAAG